MKLIIAIVHRRDSSALRDALMAEGHRFTEIGSTGGFLGGGNVTLLMGVEAERVEETLGLIRATCRSREEAVGIGPPDTRLHADTSGTALTLPVGGAQIFVMHLERAEHV
ncbi:MAG: hypothetical protein FJX74_08350 [Armatimonadetes bacterium]|nr:hypothetical protein [Armatimonadota bacterium]